MRQIYRKTHMQKCDFNKDILQIYWNYSAVYVLPFKFTEYFHSTFPGEHLWRLLLYSSLFLKAWFCFV